MINQPDTFGERDDIVATFQLENSSVRGRICRLGDHTLDAVLKRHDYPRWAAYALGEAIVLAVISAATMKVDGRVLIQAEGNGPINLLAAEAATSGGVRGYLRLDEDRWNAMEADHSGGRPSVAQMIGEGVLGHIVIQDAPNTQPYQGIVPLDGETIAECAQSYFTQSEQIPTRVRIAVEEIEEPGGTRRWRAGGAMVQQIAADSARGDTQEEWDNARALFDTVEDDELTSERLSSGDLLYRLFHEGGVRMEHPKKLEDKCTCSEERLSSTLSSMPRAEIESLAEDDGVLVADCQFCGRIYRIPVDSLIA